MRKGVLTAAGLALMAALSWSSAPAQALPLSAPKALNVAADGIDVTTQVNCWDGCGGYGYGYRPYYRPWRPYYRPYYGYRRPYYRSYGYEYGYRPHYAGYGYGGYRPYYRPYGYGYGYSPRPRFYIGNAVFGY